MKIQQSPDVKYPHDLPLPFVMLTKCRECVPLIYLLYVGTLIPTWLSTRIDKGSAMVPAYHCGQSVEKEWRKSGGGLEQPGNYSEAGSKSARRKVSCATGKEEESV